jgi:hypothetical protein
MLDSIKSILNCKFCVRILENPVILPCGETICDKHDESFRVKETAKCPICDEYHTLGESERFLANKGFERLLATEISKLELGEDYREAAKLLDELNNLKSVYDEMGSNTEDLVGEKFLAMRRKVDLIRDEIIQKVHDCSEKIISDINAYEEECKLNLSNVESKIRLSEGVFDLSGIKADLSHWRTRMKKLYDDDELCNEIRKKSEEYTSSLKKSTKE